MARSQSMLVVDAKMYRHFAIVTVALTAAIALFADGEKRAAVVEKAEAIQEFAEKDVDTGPKLIMRNASAGGGGSGLAGFYGDAGQNIYGTGVATSTSRSTRRLTKLARAVTDADLAKLGMTREQFRALSDEEKAEALKRLNNGNDAVVTDSVVKNYTSQSLKRSGGSGKSADY